MGNGSWIRWGCWYGEQTLPLPFPKGWQVVQCNSHGGKKIGDDDLRKAFAHPIGTPRLRELARGKRDAVIVVDDLTRPTPASFLVPLVIDELVRGSIKEERIRIILGIAAHHPLNREQAVKKLGKDIVERFWVQNHCPFENLDYLGKTSNGTPVYLNRDFVLADVKICIGSILPHGLSGFSGGAKMVLPGVAGIESIYQNHRPDNGYRRGIAMLKDNTTRADMEEASKMTGLDAIVNVVLNLNREIVGCFVGQFVEAHRAGCELAQKVYATPVPEECDVAVLSAYPKDSEFYQCINAFAPVTTASKRFVHDEGTYVIASASSEGIGVHYLAGPKMRLGAQWRMIQRQNLTQKPQRLFFSPNVNPHDLEQWGWDGQELCRSWREVIQRLRKRYGKDCRIAVFPCAAMQLAER